MPNDPVPRCLECGALCLELTGARRSRTGCVPRRGIWGCLTGLGGWRAGRRKSCEDGHLHRKLWSSGGVLDELHECSLHRWEVGRLRFWLTNSYGVTVTVGSMRGTAPFGACERCRKARRLVRRVASTEPTTRVVTLTLHREATRWGLAVHKVQT
jgi:hypothetical protein